MEKAIIEYNLKDPDQFYALNRTIASLDMACFCFELSFNLKKKIENEIERLSINEKKNHVLITDLIFSKINEEMRYSNIDLEKLIM